jgi:hypothetical protein
VTGVWVGNADFTPMNNTSGVTGAAPIWHNFMEAALAGHATPFSRPQGIIERQICAISGTEPSEFCPPDQVRTELFDTRRPPLPRERDLVQRTYLDPWTGLRQTAECARYYQNDVLFLQEKVVVGVHDPTAQAWLTTHPNGQAWAAAHSIPTPIVWAPTGECTAESPHPLVSIAFPPEGGTIQAGMIEIVGQAGATADFSHFVIDYGLSHDPQGWGLVMGDNTNQFNDTSKLTDWDASGLPDGPVTVRILVFNRNGGMAEARARFTIQRPTATPEPTATPTLTPTITPTATETLVSTATATGTEEPASTATATAEPTETNPTETGTP